MKPDPDVYAAVVAERYGPPIRQHTGNDGPTARWLQARAVEEAWNARRPYRPGRTLDVLTDKGILT